MKKKYLNFKNGILALAIFLIGFVSMAQNVTFSFDNASITNDGTNDYYEVDVMIQTDVEFKLGPGKLMFTYDPVAFGSNIAANGGITISYPNNYVLGTTQNFLSVYSPVASPYVDEDATRVSWSYKQNFSNALFNDNVSTGNPIKLCHLKLEIIDINLLPQTSFLGFDTQANGNDNLFSTACGGDGSGGSFEPADCNANPGTELTNDTFDSTAPTLASHVKFSFANAQNTTDVNGDYYEADVMIQTVYNTPELKLGSGKLGFNFNGNAFEENLNAAGGFEVTHPNPDYIAGQLGDPTAVDVYNNFATGDANILSVTWEYTQFLSTIEIPNNNVTATPTKLCHLKLKYKVGGLGLDPKIAFNQNITDQFSTACGGSSLLADCSGMNAGVVLTDDIYDSSGSAPTLSNSKFKLTTGLSLYPNPTNSLLHINGDTSKVTSVDVFSLSGQRVLEVKNNFQTIDLSNLTPSVYFVKITTDNTTGTLKIIKQ